MNVPLRFIPFLRPMVWGGRRLASVLGKPLPTEQAYGESWEVSDHGLHRSVVAAGPRAGQSLRELMERERAALLGPVAEQYAVFPWLVKFLDAADWLSVQVHPDDEAARRLWPGEGGKTEAWFVLDAAPGSRIYAGLRPGVGPAEFRAALEAGSVADCLHSFEPRRGDCIFLPAGTVHAVGGGVLMAEVQQTSDATFRLFDWNRRDAQGRARPLHVEEGLACIAWRQGPVQPVRVPAGDGPVRRSAAHCPYFALEYVRDREPLACAGEGRLQVLIVIQSSGRLQVGEHEEELRAGQVWVLPAALPQAWCRPKGILESLLCRLP